MVQIQQTGQRGGLIARLKPRLTELLVIVLGILLAFQVEEWREKRAEKRDVQAAMERLLEETRENLDLCAEFEPVMGENAAAVLHVFRSLEAGAFIDGNQELFDRGLIVFGVVPDIRLNSTVAGEMTATGLLKEVEDDQLRSVIARLPAMEAQSQGLLAYWRTNIIELNSELMSAVDFSYGGQALDFRAYGDWKHSMEDVMQVHYSLEELSTNRRLKNLFFEAVDVHADVWSEFNSRCVLIEQTRDALLEGVVQG